MVRSSVILPRCGCSAQAAQGQAGMLGFIYQHPVRGIQPGTPVTLMHNSWMVGVSSRTIDFGDGSPPEVVTGNKPAMTHAYAAPGLYTVTIAVGSSQVLKTSVLVEGTVPANVSTPAGRHAATLPISVRSSSYLTSR